MPPGGISSGRCFFGAYASSLSIISTAIFNACSTLAFPLGSKRLPPIPLMIPLELMKATASMAQEPILSLSVKVVEAPAGIFPPG